MKNNINKKIITPTIIFTLVAVVFFPLVLHSENLAISSSRDYLHWWNPEWPYRKLITIDHTKVSGDLTNFPILINLASDPELADAAQFSGQDIAFVLYADNETKLNHEIESYNNTNGNLIAWVNITSISSTIDTRIWMYYGNPICGDQQNVDATWNTHFLAVHHLEETNGTVYDSTQFNNDGIPFGCLNQNILGKINGADYFDGVDDHITLPQIFTNENQFSMETWIYPQTGARYFISQWNNYQGVFLQVGVNPDHIEWYIDSIGGSIGNISLNTWYHIVLTYDGVTGKLYKNGGTSTSHACNPPTWPAEDLYISDRSQGSRQFHGIIDEVRLSNIARSSAWISTEYNNQNDSSTFYGIGAEEQYPYTLMISLDGNGNVTKNPDQPTYTYGTIVTLTANPDIGWSFDHWSGDASGSSPITTVMIDGNKSITAHFTQNVYTLTISIDPATGGSVDAVPSPPYHYGDVVTLTAISNPGYSFDHWSGDLSGNSNPATLTIDGNKTVLASFIFGNTPPVAENDSAVVRENSMNNSVDVLANDYDLDGGTLTIMSVTQPSHGVSSEDGAYVYYTPLASYIGSDSFMYTISDGQGGTATAIVQITVLPANTPPYIPNAPNPENGTINISIGANLNWSGGDPDSGDIVRYTVYFGITSSPLLVSSNQSTTTYDPGILAYDTTYYWRIVSWDDHQASSRGPLWHFTTEQKEEGITVTITRPRDHSLYLRNIRLLPLPRNTILIGPITITVKVTADAGVDRVEFFIDGKLKKTDTSTPYTYHWGLLKLFKHVITVRAYDIHGQTASDELAVFKL